MPGLFQGLEIGKRALLTNQMWLQTLGHNIANVDTPGFSRQRVTVVQTDAQYTPQGLVGTGVTATNISQVRDLFLGQQYREANKSLGQWTYKEKTMSQIESLVNEPQDGSINDLLTSFFNSWSTMATGDADSSTNRQDVLQKANQLTNSFHQLAQGLADLRVGIDKDLETYTQQINQITANIAQINQQIKGMELGGTSANDLRDQRDLLTDQLANLVDVRTQEKPNGETVVAMGGMVLVDGSSSFDIGVKAVNDSGVQIHKLVWKGTDVSLTNLNGQLYGLLQTRDQVIPGYLAELNKLSRSVVEKVNAIHTTGYGVRGTTGVAFFDPTLTDAATIKVYEEIQADPSRIAATSDSTEKNLKIALAIADLQNAPVLNGGSSTMSDFYSGLVGKLGIEAKQATSYKSNYELLVQQVDNSRQSVQGVSLDEEMANMIKYQHAYDAAARVITTMDQALETVINGMGLVGR
jgi:flagellar hook-associated protein 1